MHTCTEYHGYFLHTGVERTLLIARKKKEIDEAGFVSGVVKLTVQSIHIERKSLLDLIALC